MKQKSMDTTDFQGQRMSSAFQLSTLPCVGFILTFIGGTSRIQVFCITNHAPSQGFSSGNSDQLPFCSKVPYPHVISHFPQADKQVLARWPGRAQEQRQVLGCNLSSITTLLCVHGQFIHLSFLRCGM